MPTDDQTALIDWLRERDTECPSCRYNLRGLTEPRCPECGQAVALSVTLVDAYATAWVVLAVAVCGSAGLGVIFGSLVLRFGFPGRSEALTSAICFYILMIPAPLPLLYVRRQFQRLPRRKQWIVTTLWSSFAATALIALASTLK